LGLVASASEPIGHSAVRALRRQAPLHSSITSSAKSAKRNQGIGITEELMDARSLFLTPNTTTVYVFACLDLKDGPMVMQVPPGVLGPVDDAYFRWVTDVGLTGPDAGKGGRYLYVPPGYAGPLPSEGYFFIKPRTNTLLRAGIWIGRAAPEGGRGKVKNRKRDMRESSVQARCGTRSQYR
jgi:hypothetical protein